MAEGCAGLRCAGLGCTVLGCTVLGQWLRAVLGCTVLGCPSSLCAGVGGRAEGRPVMAVYWPAGLWPLGLIACWVTTHHAATMHALGVACVCIWVVACLVVQGGASHHAVCRMGAFPTAVVEQWAHKRTACCGDYGAMCVPGDVATHTCMQCEQRCLPVAMVPGCRRGQSRRRGLPQIRGCVQCCCAGDMIGCTTPRGQPGLQPRQGPSGCWRPGARRCQPRLFCSQCRH